MARTISSLLVGMLKDDVFVGEREEVSHGEIYVEAQRRGYNGEQVKLMEVADRLVAHGILTVAPKGMREFLYYGLNGGLVK